MALLDILNADFLSSALRTLAGQTKATRAHGGENTPGGLGGLGDLGGLGGLGGLFGAGDRAGGSPYQQNGLGGLLGAGAVGALLGNVVSGNVMKTAALVGVGAVAWNFYQKWSSSQQEQAEPQTAELLQPSMTMGLDATSEMVVRVMVFAARADGSIDAEERQRMNAVIQNMIPERDVSALLTKVQQEMLDPSVFASQVRSLEQGEDIYRLSCVVIDIDSFMEHSYMDGLAKALRISESRKTELEDEAREARRHLMLAVSA